MIVLATLRSFADVVFPWAGDSESNSSKSINITQKWCVLSVIIVYVVGNKTRQWWFPLVLTFLEERAAAEVRRLKQEADGSGDEGWEGQKDVGDSGGFVVDYF